MGWADALVARARLTVGVAVLLSVAGVWAWFNMPREEDPRLAERVGLMVVPMPGADTEQVERLVVQPLEDELMEIDDVKQTEATVRSGVAILTIELRDSVTATDEVWNRVREAADRARHEMPNGVLPATLDHALMETESIVLAVTGFNDVIELADAAERLRRRLLTLPEVSRVKVSGDPGEQITVALDESASERLGLTPERLAGLLSSRNAVIPGGTIRAGDRRVELRPATEMGSLGEIASTPVVLPSGAAVPLDQLAEIRRMPLEPEGERARLNGKPAVMLGVIPRQGLDASDFGRAVRYEVEAFKTKEPAVSVAEVAFQPARVDARLSELGISLLIGVGIVAAVLLIAMGVRVGILVASVAPTVTFASLAIYAMGGGVLHQIAVAALVLALGLVVDNAIVMAEAIQRRLDEGQQRHDAVRGAVRELAVPLASATATTLAAFVPMLLAPGGSGDFTRAIPIVAMLTLTVSYLVAIGVTPALGGWILRPSTKRGTRRLESIARRIGTLSCSHPVWTLAGVVLVIGLSGAFAGRVKHNFFPASDRDQLVVSLSLPEGSHLDATDDAARSIERALLEHAGVLSVASFVGRGVPSFYYNLSRSPESPHVAEFLVTTRDTESVGSVQAFVRSFAQDNLPDATIVARRLEQGPPAAAPVEVRLLGDDLEALHAGAEMVQRWVREDPATLDVRSTMGPGSPLLDYRIDDAAAARRGLARVHVGYAMYGRTRGLEAGMLRTGSDPVPVRLRAPKAEEHSPADVDAIVLLAEDGSPVTVSGMTDRALGFSPAVIRHYRGVRTVSVLAEVAQDATHEQVISRLRPHLDALQLPDGVRWEIGGAAGSAAEANGALAGKAPFAALLLVGILLLQFNSLRRVFVVLLTAPMAMLGVWPGLWAGDLPFGFVALLGAIALIGIAVNAAIVLLDLADERRKAGDSVQQALIAAVEIRTRPILLTTVTTVAGLAPLLFSESTLWPPMAAAMISGLTVATLLTLFAVPALYRLLFRDSSPAYLAR